MGAQSLPRHITVTEHDIHDIRLSVAQSNLDVTIMTGIIKTAHGSEICEIQQTPVFAVFLKLGLPETRSQRR